ncbi:hypothetical protein [Staphylococcus aureus]|uniref:hypothetical protein n=1 Tax=Staphylococcus aureus TaxID=1280 RepID=UPI00229E598C|nr:hypothetical protein [Staphylococcus aureus]HDF5500785.1 hypothetical protein [Staphylococcus aureus]HEH3173335.1 hypothetical protein [Staphylococcus aureus]
MKIKVKKEMRLDELIKWARENPDLSQGKIFFSTGFSDGFVRFHPNTNKCSTSSFIPIDIPFIVDVEKEITEETKFDRLVGLERNDDLTIWENRSIKGLVDDFSKAFYILNDDLTMTLIWKDGELLV